MTIRSSLSTITGDSGGKWFLLRENDSWNLYLDVASPAAGGSFY